MTPTEFMRLYESRTAAHDLDGTLALIAEEAVYLFSDGSSHILKLAIEKVLAANFAAIRDESYRLQNITWLEASDDIAVCVYKFFWTGTIDGKPASGSGRGTSVLRRDGESWLIAHEHLSKGEL
jgi:ketosteroid isomerase-like protein